MANRHHRNRAAPDDVFGDTAQEDVGLFGEALVAAL
jgi:hypothetical protein